MAYALIGTAFFAVSDLLLLLGRPMPSPDSVPDVLAAGYMIAIDVALAAFACLWFCAVARRVFVGPLTGDWLTFVRYGSPVACAMIFLFARPHFAHVLSAVS